VVTVTGPAADGMAGTVAVILDAEVTVNAAAMPVKVTAVAPVKFAPVIVTGVPAGPVVGVKKLIRKSERRWACGSTRRSAAEPGEIGAVVRLPRVRW
jgi:hypothetical protein